MGFGILFRLDESSLGSHLNERRVRGEEEGINDTEQSEPFKEISDSGSDTEKEVSGGKATLNSSNLMDLSSEQLAGESISLAASSNDLDVPDVTIKHDAHDEMATSVNYTADDKKSDSSSKISSAVTPNLEDLIDRALELGSTTASGTNYGLQASQEEIVKEHDPQLTKAVQREKPYISKAERRKLKKGQKDGSVVPPAEHEKETGESHDPLSQPDNHVKSSKPGSGKISRGQKGKLKKIKEKYADQDEEERSIRMALLAAAGKSKKNVEKSANEKPTAEKGAKLAAAPLDDASKICYKCKKAGHMTRDCPEHPDETLRSKADGEVDRTGSEMDRVTMEEDDIHEIGEEEKEKLNDVDYLTGNPLPNDVLLGTTREKELMKACTDPELVAAIIGNVKVSAAGLTQLKQKQKKNKKASKAES
ncbi:UNVERIFIED_CONTAM: Nuclear export mediator factor NEMF [Sesamum radiatum]|uniref:Nuclear export mediator factor NEMF n=1 Tax=Sesamum radiatum TaxID=300843 RepID=A0AAW2QK98_SESRA